MKKSIVALATLSAIGTAFADVDVSGGIKLYGVLDESVQSQSLVSPVSTVSDSKTTGLFSTAATSRFGVRASRDLGDDLKAELQVEIELDPDTSTLLPAKNRGTFVGLSNPTFGTIRLGTQETTAYEIFGNDVNGRVEYKPQVWRTTASSSTQDRANNSLKFISNEFLGTKFHIMRGYSEYPTTDTNAPNFYSLGLKFKKDNLRLEYVRDKLTHTSAGYAFYGQANAGVTKTRLTTSSSNGTIASALLYYDGQDSSKEINRNIFSASYDFGNFSLNYIYADSVKVSKGSLVTNTFGIRMPLEKFVVALSYGLGTVDSSSSSSTNPTATADGSVYKVSTKGLTKDAKISDVTLGITYLYDKSTSFYTYYSSGSFTGGMSQDGAATTMAVGLRYNF